VNCKPAECECSELRAQIHTLFFGSIKYPSFVGQKYILKKKKPRDRSLREEEYTCVSLRVRKAALVIRRPF
jgi:hypothetical protein